MQQDYGKNIPVRDRLIEALETQIENRGRSLKPRRKRSGSLRNTMMN